MIKLLISSLIMAVSSAAPAFAHHPLGGTIPQTFWQGFASGIGHPIIGFDHLAFLIAFGVLIAFLQARYLLIAGFIAAIAIGNILTVAGIQLGFVELVVASSIVLFGALVISGRGQSVLFLLPASIIAGLFHGYAFGETVIGAEPTPIFAYLFGLSVIQAVMIIIAGTVVRLTVKTTEPFAVGARLSGAVCSGVGLTFLLEMAEKAIF